MASVGLNKKNDFELSCICGINEKEKTFVLKCSVCGLWFHGSCVDIKEENADLIEEYHCQKCFHTHGPLILKKRFIPCLDLSLESYPQQSGIRTGSKQFLEMFKTRQFLSSKELPLKKIRGSKLNSDYLDKRGFRLPILVKNKEGLELETPQPTFSALQVEELVGSMKEISIIDVSRQEDHKIFLREWIDYFTSSTPKKKTLNLLSLEFSNSKLSQLVNPPKIVLDVSWVSQMWPENEWMYLKPEVQKYCLMSVEDCYTDFHIDFGGSSVWYHVCRGQKVFYLIEPTNKNLELFQEWLTSPQQPHTFFGDLVDRCYKVEIKQGETVFLPSGWIHAVWTPVESLVFGGNFLNSYNTEMQLKVYEMERKTRAPSKYLFPNFEPLHWYVAQNIANKVKGYLDDKDIIPKHLVDALEPLSSHLSLWFQDKENMRNQPVPDSVNSRLLLRDLQKLKKLIFIPVEHEINKKPYFKLDLSTPINNISLSTVNRKRKKTKSKINISQFFR